METLAAARFRFGDFELDCARRSLKRNGQKVTLAPKAFDLLQQLVENHGSFMSKDELMDRVWPDQFVEENNLTVQIAALRQNIRRQGRLLPVHNNSSGKGLFVHRKGRTYRY